MKVIYKTLTVLSFCLQGREHDDYNCFFFFFFFQLDNFSLALLWNLLLFLLKYVLVYGQISFENHLGYSETLLATSPQGDRHPPEVGLSPGKERGREGCFTDVFYCRGESCVHLKTSLCGLDCKTPSSSITAVCHTRPEQVVCFLGFQEKKWAQKAARLYLSQLQKPIFSKTTTCVLG